MSPSKHRNAAPQGRILPVFRELKAGRTRGALLAAAGLVSVMGLWRLSADCAPIQAYAPSSPATKAATSYAQVAPILKRNCTSCHNPQGGAPFSLQSYADAKQWGEQMLEVTQSRYMPPWLPAPGHGDFQGQRRLTDAELATLRAWVTAGMPEGSSSGQGSHAEASAVPKWKLGAPDLTLQLPAPVALSGSGPDMFLNLIVPYTGTQSHAIRALEIRASDPQAVRSIWVQLDPVSAFRHAQGADTHSEVAGMEPPDAIQAQLTSPGGLLFWTADAPLLTSGARSTWNLAPGNDLVLTTHLKTTGRSEAVQLTVAVYYAHGYAHGEKKVRSPEVLELERGGPIQIPSGEADYQLEDQFTLPAPVKIEAIYPRVHFLGKQLNAYADFPNGQRQWLISIPKWDVDWQSVYRYSKPVLLPKGAVVHWRYTYDNSSNNPHNPNDPPEPVHAGIGAKDETDQLWLELTAPAGVTDEAGWRRQLHNAARQQYERSLEQHSQALASSSAESGR